MKIWGTSGEDLTKVGGQMKNYRTVVKGVLRLLAGIDIVVVQVQKLMKELGYGTNRS